MLKISPFLWYDNQAEEAVNLYTSIFKNSKVLEIRRYGPGAPSPEGTVMTVRFQLENQEIIALNAGPYFKFTEAFSFFVECDDAGGSRQLVGRGLPRGRREPVRLAQGPVRRSRGRLSQGSLAKCLPTRTGRRQAGAMQAMLTMSKIDVNVIREAVEQA